MFQVYEFSLPHREDLSVAGKSTQKGALLGTAFHAMIVVATRLLKLAKVFVPS